MILKYIALTLALVGPATAILEDAIDVIKLSREIGKEVLESWHLIAKPLNISSEVELPVFKRRERLVLSKLAQVYAAIGRVDMQVDRMATVANLLAQRSHRGTALELKLDETAKQLERVQAQNARMLEYVENHELLERSTLEQFAAWCVSPGGESLSWVLERLNGLVMPGRKHLLGRGLFQLMIEELQNGHPELCELQMSPHQIVFDTYNAIMLAEIKGYAMMQYSWMLLRIYGKGNYTQEANLTRKKYADRTARTAAAARAALQTASRSLYRCDPPQHIEGKTYAEVTKLLQGVIENEVNLNKDNTCKENCAYYTVTKSYGCRDSHCDQLRKCNGRIINCQYIDSDMWTCPAARNSHRRYNWIEYENGQMLGKYETCSQGTTKVDSWWKLSKFQHCTYCFCVCEDESRQGEKFFSLREALADFNKRKVVTGVRLVKLDRVFHLQISEGTLGERGNVTPGSWVPVAKFDPTEQGTVEGQDYHTLTYERRAIDLDELDSPVGHVLTGVRFRMLGAHLHFEIRSTPFNYTTGRLQPEKSQWISNDNTDGAEIPRTKLELSVPDVPTRMHTAHQLDSNHDQYLEFTHTDIHADAAQTTVPFVDVQDVQPLDGAALLSGAGVVHRGLPGSGGFLAMKLFTYDQSRHVRADPPPAQSITDGDNAEFAPVMN